MFQATRPVWQKQAWERTLPGSEAIAQGELDYAAATVRDHLPQGGVRLLASGIEARRPVERAKLCMVQEIVEFTTELQPVVLVEFEHLGQRNIPLVYAGLAHDVARCVAIVHTPGLRHSELCGARTADGGRVEPGVKTLLEAVGLQRSEHRHTRSFSRAGEVAWIRGRQRDVAWNASLDLGVTGQ